MVPIEPFRTQLFIAKDHLVWLDHKIYSVRLELKSNNINFPKDPFLNGVSLYRNIFVYINLIYYYEYRYIYFY